jgi:hypothetical protein
LPDPLKRGYDGVLGGRLCASLGERVDHESELALHGIDLVGEGAASKDLAIGSYDFIDWIGAVLRMMKGVLNQVVEEKGHRPGARDSIGRCAI